MAGVAAAAFLAIIPARYRTRAPHGPTKSRPAYMHIQSMLFARFCANVSSSVTGILWKQPHAFRALKQRPSGWLQMAIGPSSIARNVSSVTSSFKRQAGRFGLGGGSRPVRPHHMGTGDQGAVGGMRTRPSTAYGVGRGKRANASVGPCIYARGIFGLITDFSVVPIHGDTISALTRPATVLPNFGPTGVEPVRPETQSLNIQKLAQIRGSSLRG